MFQVACSLFVINKVVAGGMFTTDGTQRTLLHGNGTELHGLGVERQQTVCQQLDDTCKK